MKIKKIFSSVILLALLTPSVVVNGVFLIKKYNESRTTQQQPLLDLDYYAALPINDDLVNDFRYMTFKDKSSITSLPSKSKTVLFSDYLHKKSLEYDSKYFTIIEKYDPIEFKTKLNDFLATAWINGYKDQKFKNWDSLEKEDFKITIATSDWSKEWWPAEEDWHPPHIYMRQPLWLTDELYNNASEKVDPVNISMPYIYGVNGVRIEGTNTGKVIGTYEEIYKVHKKWPDWPPGQPEDLDFSWFSWKVLLKHDNNYLLDNIYMNLKQHIIESFTREEFFSMTKPELNHMINMFIRYETIDFLNENYNSKIIESLNYWKNLDPVYHYSSSPWSYNWYFKTSPSYNVAKPLVSFSKDHNKWVDSVKWTNRKGHPFFVEDDDWDVYILTDDSFKPNGKINDVFSIKYNENPIKDNFLFIKNIMGNREIETQYAAHHSTTKPEDFQFTIDLSDWDEPIIKPPPEWKPDPEKDPSNWMEWTFVSILITLGLAGLGWYILNNKK